jgi:hypothetical protein
MTCTGHSLTHTNNLMHSLVHSLNDKHRALPQTDRHVNPLYAWTTYTYYSHTRVGILIHFLHSLTHSLSDLRRAPPPHTHTNRRFNAFFSVTCSQPETHAQIIPTDRHFNPFYAWTTCTMFPHMGRHFNAFFHSLEKIVNDNQRSFPQTERCFNPFHVCLSCTESLRHTGI